MGPIALFDKSFLQSLSEDESVWFAHYYLPVVCPLFYIETLADLDKDVRDGRTPEQEVRIIARKFPDQSAAPCAHHMTCAIGELLGHELPMDGTIPMPGGRVVENAGKTGVVYDASPEARAFGRWMNEEFDEIEHGAAREWRRGLVGANLEDLAKPIRELGLDAVSCKSLDEVFDLAHAAVAGSDQHFQRMELAIQVLKIPREYHLPIMERWASNGYPPLVKYAPYTAHIVSVELFFLFGIASGQIGTSRASNRVDIAYLFYLPFCMVFVSNDKLHRRCASYFLRKDQQFVWGNDLKRDLARINEHFMAFPEAEKERGIMAFASRAPDLGDSLTRDLRETYLAPGYDDQPEIEPPVQDGKRSRELVDVLKTWQESPESGRPLKPNDDPEMISIGRQVRRKKGSWWQVPKDLETDGD